ncbi:hypothetical protein B0H17DRAFT_1142128 [Mycena rosella]|nr:hypothetical protein B0H17DRAFT_1142128 [Mycena rosella]
MTRWVCVYHTIPVCAVRVQGEKDSNGDQATSGLLRALELRRYETGALPAVLRCCGIWMLIACPFEIQSDVTLFATARFQVVISVSDIARFLSGAVRVENGFDVAAMSE